MRTSVEMVGTSHRKEAFAVFLENNNAADTIELVPDPTNPHDRNAVKVVWRGIHIGFVQRSQAERLVSTAHSQGVGWRVTHSQVRVEDGYPVLFLTCESYRRAEMAQQR